MPYFVERDFGGKICGLYANPQHKYDGSLRTEPDQLPDNHPEVVEFLSRMPTLTQAHMTDEDFKREKEDQEKVDRDTPRLQELALQHIQTWAELETALSALFYTVLNIQPSTSHIAYAIYYGMTGFDARMTAVSNSFIQLMDENKDLDFLRGDWKTVLKKLSDARDNRNTYAHGTIQTVIFGSKPRRKQALISPLPFDVIRMNRHIKEKGRPKSFDVHEFERIVKREFLLARCLDSFNTIVSQYRRFGSSTFQMTTPELADQLKALTSP